MTPRTGAWRTQARLSAIHHLLRALAVARTVRRQLCVLDLTEIVRRQLDVGCRDVLLETARLRRARYWDDPRFLREQPRQRNLRRCRAFPLRDATEKVDEPSICL